MEETTDNLNDLKLLKKLYMCKFGDAGKDIFSFEAELLMLVMSTDHYETSVCDRSWMLLTRSYLYNDTFTYFKLWASS